MNSRQIRAYCDLGTDSERMLERAMQQQGPCVRAHDGILKVARTIADMEGSPQIESKHTSLRQSSTGRWTGRTGRIGLGLIQRNAAEPSGHQWIISWRIAFYMLPAPDPTQRRTPTPEDKKPRLEYRPGPSTS
ncbi:MAG TPA: hypothetical protein VIJ01_18935 [Candidatus Angelobacter sp.]|jgi:hypothetical protein